MTTLSLVVMIAAAVPATATSPVRAAAAVDPSDLSAGQALAQAKQTGQSVVATGMTTPVGQTTANPNGTLTLTQSNQPVRTLRNGTWVGLDPTLVRNADGSYSPTATTGALTLSGGGSARLATMSAAGHQLTLTFPVTLPTPTVSGATATYPNVLAGVDLVITADQQGGLADTLVVKNASAATNPALAHLHIATTSRDLTVASNSSGVLAVTDPAGHAIYTSPTSMMWDSTPAPATATAATAPTPALVQAADGGTIDTTTGLPLNSSPLAPGEDAQQAAVGVAANTSGITLTANQSLLTGPNTIYPVFIDPSLTLNPDSYGAAADWTEVESGNTGYAGWHQSGLEQVGDCAWPNCGTVGVARSYFQWNITPLYGTQIITSQLNVTETYSAACSPGVNESVWLEWTGGIGSGTNWNNKPGIISTVGPNSSCPAQGMGWNVTSQVTSGVNGRSGTTTFGLQAASETDKYGWAQFSDTATLTTTYDVNPLTPIYPNATPGGCTTSAPYAVIGRTDVSLAVTTRRASDNVAKPLNITFHIVNVATGVSIYGNSPDPVIQTTAGAWASLAVSKTLLATGDYSWKVQAYDGYLPSGWMPTCYLHVDTTQPAPPTIASTDYPNAAQGKAVRTPGTFTFNPGAGASPPASYRYQLNSGAPVTVTPNASGVWTGSITPTRIGVDTLTVQALSPAGTPSTPTTWQITPAPLANPDPDGDLIGNGHPDVLTVGGTSGTTPGLWLSTSNTNGQLNPPTDIGIRGTGLGTSTGTPTDWTGSITTHGQFTGDGMQDILAVLPNGNPYVYSNPGDGSALNPGAQTPISLANGSFFDPSFVAINPDHSETITQLTAVGHLPVPGSSPGAVNVAFPDLIAVVHDTQPGVGQPNQLWLLPHGPVAGNYLNPAYVLDASIDWSTKTITGTVYQGQPALLVRDNTSGEIDLYPTCTNPSCTGVNGWFADAATSKITMVPATNATNATNAPVLASEDTNNDGNPDLWTISPTGTAHYGAGTSTGTLGSLTNAGTVIPAASAGLIPMGAANWTNPTTNQTQTDVYAADSSGNLWDYPRMPSGILGPPTLVAVGHWNNYTVFGVVDFNHDGYPDIVLRDNTTCNENVYLGSASGFATTPVQFGVGWCGYTPFGIEDWYHDGHYDVLARSDGDGVIWLYQGDLTGDNNGTRTQIGSGWTAGVYDPYGVIDFNGDGHTDILTRYDPTNILKIYVGDGTGGGYPTNGTEVGSGFNGLTFFGALDYDGVTTEPQIIARKPDGTVLVYTGNGSGGWSDGLGRIIANGW